MWSDGTGSSGATGWREGLGETYLGVRADGRMWWLSLGWHLCWVAGRWEDEVVELLGCE